MPSSEKSPPCSDRIKTAGQLERALAESRKREPLRAGEPWDRLEGGGLRRGSLIELCGPRSCGGFAAALTALACATGAGEAAAFIDLGDQLDPRSAESAGVMLRRLLWVRPRSLKEALIGTHESLGAGFALVVLDLGDAGAAGAPLGSWLRLSRAARQAQAVLLLLSRQPTAGPAAAARIQAEKASVLWDAAGPPLLRGLSTRWTLLRGR